MTLLRMGIRQIAGTFGLSRTTIQHGILRQFLPGYQVGLFLWALTLPYQDPTGLSCTTRLRQLQSLAPQANKTELMMETLANPLRLFETTNLSSVDIAQLYYHTLKCGVPGNLQLMPGVLYKSSAQFTYHCYSGSYRGNLVFQPQCLCDPSIHTTDYPAGFCGPTDCPYGNEWTTAGDCVRCPMGTIKPTSGKYKCLTSEQLNAGYMYVFCREWPMKC